MICIQVYDSRNGKPLENAKVALGFHGFTNMGSTPYVHTDSNGCAYFDREPDNDVTVYINGSTVHRGPVSGAETFHV